MTLELVNPEELAIPESYTQVIGAKGTRLVFVAGQVSEDARGHLVGIGDLAAQATQVFSNLGHALTAMGARLEDVTRITIYVVHFRSEDLPVISAARGAIFGAHKPTDTLVGVEALADASHLIEVDAIAVVD